MKKEKKQEKRPLSHLAFLLISLVLGLLVGFFIIFYLWQIGPASFFSFLRTDIKKHLDRLPYWMAGKVEHCMRVIMAIDNIKRMNGTGFGKGESKRKKTAKHSY